ncbi:MAG TPA: HEAT repeat domain-containing protein, partial [Chthoniobacteraceae bacterium]
MKALVELLSQPAFHRLGWVLLHFLWQGVVIGLLLAFVLLDLDRASARLRYIITCAALFACSVAPMITWVALNHSPATVRISPQSGGRFESRPAAASQASPSETKTSLQSRPAPTANSSNASTETARGFAVRPTFDSLLPGVVLLWFIGVLYLSSRLAFSWLQLRRLRRSGVEICDPQWVARFARLIEQMRLRRPVRLLESALVEVPTLLGWLRPVILLPASVFTGLTPAQLEAVLAHELAHVRRWDYLTNLLQSFIEIALFYHPAVWWISRKLREERENCCDDVALETMQDRVLYASALAALEERRSLSPPLVLAIAQGTLLARIRRIAGVGGRKSSLAPVMAVALIAGGAIVRSLSFAPTIFLANVFSSTRLSAQEGTKATDAPARPEPWQVAGIRASFGDVRVPFVEPSPAVQREALKICALNGWGAALDPREVAVYLGSKDVTVRIAAVEALRQTGPAGRPYAKQVAALLGDRAPPARMLAALTLAGMGEAGAPFAKEVAALCIDPEFNVRLNALAALRKMGEIGRLDCRAFVKANAGELTKENMAQQSIDALRAPIMKALAEMETMGLPVAADVAPLLADRDPAVRRAGAYVLGELGGGRKFAKDIAALLRDDDAAVRLAAVVVLSKLGREGAAHAREIAGLINDPERTVRIYAISALGGMREDGAAFAPEVDAALKAGDVWSAAADALSNMGDKGAAFAPDLIAALETGHGGVAGALGTMGKNGAPVADHVAALLEDKDPNVRESAVTALGQMGAAAIPWSRALVARFGDDDRDVRRSAAKALAQMAKDGDPVPEEMTALLEDRRLEVRCAALDALRQMGIRAAGFVTAVEALLQDDDIEVRGAAAMALGPMTDPGGPPSPQPAPETKRRNPEPMAALSEEDRRFPHILVGDRRNSDGEADATIAFA